MATAAAVSAVSLPSAASGRMTTTSPSHIPDSSNSNSVSVETIRAANWAGCIPTLVSLAPTSLSSPTIPPPVHILLPRHSFLHVGFRSAVLRLANFAPPVYQHHHHHRGGSNSNNTIMMRNEEPDGATSLDDGSNNDTTTGTNSPTNNHHDLTRRNSSNISNASHHHHPNYYPVCWFEDEEGQVALRWHLFAGVLFDMTKPFRSQQQQQPLSNQRHQQHQLPWKIRLHFTSYPHSQLLPLDSTTSPSDAHTSNDDHGGVWTTLQRSFKHSLKQALFLQHGNSRIALNLTKQSHERIWESIVACNYSWYRQVNDTELQVQCDDQLYHLPIRLFIDAHQPPQQRPCKPRNDDNMLVTLGDLLFEWAPQWFTKQITSDNNDNSNESTLIQPTAPYITWWVGGITPSLTCPLLELWRHLCHPDHMLYIVLITRPS